MSKINFNGIEIDNLNREEVMAKIELLLKEKRPHHVVTVNPEIFLEGLADDHYRQILNQADLKITDGIGILLASRYLGNSLKERFTGVDLMLSLAKLASKNSYGVYFLGGHGRVAEKTAQNLLERYGNLKVCGWENGFRLWGLRLPDKVLLQKINRVKPEILFVAFGAPKQEKWLYKNLRHLKTVRLAIGVGGAFDYIAKKVIRAPKFMRSVGLEWLWRLIVEPWRLPRIINATYHFSHEIIKHKRKTK